ncbi:MAG: HEAT repeat domain-containing protein [Planctomycetes bacterium]|nr:HEAT repeat domain-containing protein [Planctomycetota bacterium]
MKCPLLLLFPVLAPWFAGCASTATDPYGNKVAVPDEEARQRAIAEAEQRRRAFENVLLKLDQAMESYAVAIANRGVARADQQAEQLEKLIRDLVLDRGAQSFDKRADQETVEPLPIATGDNFHRLRAAAIDGSNTYHQGIALAALGFSEDTTVMPTILQGAQLDDPVLVDRAVFGLAILRAPDTPPGVLGAVIENQRLPANSRAQAAWALYRLQSTSSRPEEIAEIWRRVATHDRDTAPPGALVQAVRGLGLTRDDSYGDIVAPFAHHTVPLLRMAAADALARMNAQDHAEDLIALIGPAESVPNVRLHARKALQALAGQVDYGYDVAAWRKAFERR